MQRGGDPLHWMLAGLLVLAGVLYVFLPRPRAARQAGSGRPKVVITCIGGQLERDRQMWQALEAGFERDHPDIDLHVLRGGGTQRKVDAMIAGGVAPDILEVNADNAHAYIEAGALRDLTPLVTGDPELARDVAGYTDAAGRWHEPDYFAFALDAFRAGPRLYALPIWYCNFVVYYNKALFDRYRVPYPDEDWDWRGFRERCIALTRDRAGRPVRIPLRDAAGRPVTDARGWTVYVDNPAADDVPYDYGLWLAVWQHGPECFTRAAGGRFLAGRGTPDERVDFDSPAVREALWFLYETAIVNRTLPVQFVAQTATHDLAFKGGHVGMLGPYGVFALLDLRDQIRSFEWDVAPLPKAPDGTRASLVLPFGLAVSAQSRHPQEAFAFVKWFSGRRGAAILSRWPLFVPARRSIALSEEHFLDPATRPDSDWALVHDVSTPYTDPRTGARQIGYTFLPEAASVRHADVYEAISQGFAELFYYGNYTRDAFRAFEAGHARPPDPAEALALHRAAVDRAVADINRNAARAYRWAERQRADPPAAGAWPLWAPLALVLLAAGGLVAWRVGRHPYRAGPLERRQQWWGYALLSPWLVGLVCLTAGPILFSVGLSLCRWQSLGSLDRAEFVGLDNYARALRGDDPLFYRALRATAQYTALAVPLHVAGGLALALLMNTRLRGINLWRTFYFVPSVLPVVAVVVLYYYLFNPAQGWVNHVLRALGWSRPPAWLTSDEPVLGVPAPMWMFVLMSLWTVGGSMIIYLGSLQGIPTQLYEAAEVDGAGRLRRFRHVTLPMISPVLFFMLIMGIISSFQVFTNAYVLFESAGGPRNATLFYVLHLFNEAVNRHRFGYGAALAWILFAILLALTALVLKSSPLWVYYEGARERARR